jgi:hypothetical protein
MKNILEDQKTRLIMRTESSSTSTVVFDNDEGEPVMSMQVSVPFMIPTIADHFHSVWKENPEMKMGATVCCVGNELHKHFQLCGQIVARLERDGWTIHGYVDGCRAQHEDVITEPQAILRLKAIGIDPKDVIVSSTWDNWFEEDTVLAEQDEEEV